MTLLQGEVYEAYRSELLKRYRQLLTSLGKDQPKDKIKQDALPVAMPLWVLHWNQKRIARRKHGRK